MQIRPILDKDIPAVARLMRTLSEEFIVHESTTEAAASFIRENDEAGILDFIDAGIAYRVADIDGRVVGFIAIRDHRHLFHMFVDKAYHRRGIARQLWEVARKAAIEAGNPGVFTVNSSNYALPVYEALGTVDELTSLLGLCRAQARGQRDELAVAAALEAAQECLFTIQAEVAGAPKSLTPLQVKALEETIGRWEDGMARPRGFVIPGATPFSALCDYARAVARRAERSVARLDAAANVSPESRAYLNRLSSFLYTLARYAASRAGVKESSPTYS